MLYDILYSHQYTYGPHGTLVRRAEYDYHYNYNYDSPHYHSGRRKHKDDCCNVH